MSVVRRGEMGNAHQVFSCSCGHRCQQPYQLLAGALGQDWVGESGKCCICEPDSCDGRALPSCDTCQSRVQQEATAEKERLQRLEEVRRQKEQQEARKRQELNDKKKELERLEKEMNETDVYGDDGYSHPVYAAVGTETGTGTGRMWGTNTAQIRNTGPLEFPINANMRRSSPYGLSAYNHGGAHSPGRSTRSGTQCSDDGRRKAISYLLELPGYGSTISITNSGPLEYPLTASVVPYGLQRVENAYEDTYGGGMMGGGMMGGGGGLSDRYGRYGPGGQYS